MTSVVSMGASTVRRPGRPGRHVLVLVILAVPALLLGLDLAIGGSTPRVSAALQALCAAVATWASVRAGHRATDRWRRSWRLLAWSSAVWLVGALGAIATDGIVTDDTFPTVLDGARIVALVIALIALTAVPDRHDRWRRALLGLDGLVLAASVLYVVWTLRTGTRYGVADLGAGDRAVVLIHLGVDAVVFGFAIGLLVRAPGRARLPTTLVSVAFLATAVTDAVFIDRGLGGSFQLGSPSDVGWAAALVLLGAAALNASAEPRESTDRVSDRIIMGASLVALVPLVVIFFISVARTPLEGAPHTIEWLLLASAVVLCVVARLIALRDNIALTEDLAEDVAARSDELAAAVHLQRLTLNAVHEGIVGLREGQLVFANDAAGEILRVPHDELIGRFVFEVLTIGPADHSQLAAIYAAITARQRVELVGEPVVRGDGSTFAIDLSITPVVHPDLTSVAVFRDVSHRTEVERLKNEFVSVVSHELRTPLTSIRGSLGLLAGGAVGELSPPARRMAVIATENTERLIRLINDILDLERIESGAAVLDLAPRPAAELIATSLQVVVPVAAETDVAVATGPIDGTVLGDGDRLVQVLVNLLANAVKFSPPGTTVTVAAVPDGPDIVFTVSDHGRGIPVDQLERIFDRFHQVDASDTRQQGGTGLGLAICASIVHQHGGRIWAENRGDGATLSFTVPAAPADAPVRTR
jgi:PAS domain S-box-containing protein